MPRPRQPTQKAAVAGRDVINPGRFRDRRDPKAPPLGVPPRYFSDHQKMVWSLTADEIPWLNRSHRPLLEIAVTIRARIVAGEDVGVQALNLLRQCLGQMGATPADASKVSVPDEGDDDPDEQFFAGRPN
jgi:hypothetical protein